MTPQEFAQEMKKIQKKHENADAEPIHADMDELMCEVLIENGFEKGVEIFRKQRKWYA